MNSNPNPWDAVSAIGTVLGAVMTFFASCIALYQASASTRPRLRAIVTYVLDEDGIKKRRFSATAGKASITNVGLIPISLIDVEIRDNFSWKKRSIDLGWIFKDLRSEQPTQLVSKVIEPGQSYVSDGFIFALCADRRPSFADTPLSSLIGTIRSRLLGPVTVRVIASDGKGYRASIPKKSKDNIERAIVLSSQLGDAGLMTNN